MSGYAYCACRDCFNEVVGDDLCAYCEDAGCDASGESECECIPCIGGSDCPCDDCAAEAERAMLHFSVFG